MAKASVKVVCHVCGKKFEITKNCFNRKEADNFESWAMNQQHTCSDCYWGEMKRRETEANEKAKASISFPLPALEGSEKQIAWADSIRAKFIAELEAAVDWLEVEEKMPAFWNDVIKNASAKFWIEIRNKHPFEVMGEYVK